MSPVTASLVAPSPTFPAAGFLQFAGRGRAGGGNSIKRATIVGACVASTVLFSASCGWANDILLPTADGEVAAASQFAVNQVRVGSSSLVAASSDAGTYNALPWTVSAQASEVVFPDPGVSVLVSGQGYSGEQGFPGASASLSYQFLVDAPVGSPPVAEVPVFVAYDINGDHTPGAAAFQVQGILQLESGGTTYSASICPPMGLGSLPHFSECRSRSVRSRAIFRTRYQRGGNLARAIVNLPRHAHYFLQWSG